MEVERDTEIGAERREVARVSEEVLVERQLEVERDTENDTERQEVILNDVVPVPEGVLVGHRLEVESHY